MKWRMPLLALALAPATVLATGVPSNTVSPSTRLTPGQWSFHSKVKAGSGMAAGHTVSKDWKTCLKNDKSAVQALAPREKSGKVKCSKPTLEYDKTSYRTRMECTMQMRGLNSKMIEDFVLTPGKDGKTFLADGTVDQQLTIPGMSARHVHTKISVRAKRIGECPAE